jgi:hypothetical protein
MPARHLPPTALLLVQGGDARIALDPDSLNKYGCSPLPDPGLLALGSSTASGISVEGFAAADRLRNKLVQAVESDAAVYAAELDRIRLELLDLCGLSALPGVELVFAASGTDLHLIAAQIGGAARSAPVLALMVDAQETGSGVPAALAGRHFSSRAALGDAVIEGELITDDAIAGDRAITVATVAIRQADGTPRTIAEIDKEFATRATQAAEHGQRVLLVLADVSKTGMIAPSPACALALQHKLSSTVDVLVDACQFRIAPATLQTYLEHGFMVALTGSKFVTGPPFSGALLIPASAARRLRSKPLPRSLTAYSSRADWPANWDTAALRDDVPNFGLLLRWEAALQELRAFRSLAEADVNIFLKNFSHAIHNRLQSDPAFEPLAVPALNRHPLIDASAWDHNQTIFPFLLFHAPAGAAKTPLSREQTLRVYRLLQIDLSDHADADSLPFNNSIAALRCQLGQPVACGMRYGVAVSALRLCASARLVVEACEQGGENASSVIANALAALDKTALLVLPVEP